MWLGSVRNNSPASAHLLPLPTPICCAVTWPQDNWAKISVGCPGICLNCKHFVQAFWLLCVLCNMTMALGSHPQGCRWCSAIQKLFRGGFVAIHHDLRCPQSFDHDHEHQIIIDQQLIFPRICVLSLHASARAAAICNGRLTRRLWKQEAIWVQQQ